jgi:hypothetical protein
MRNLSAVFAFVLFVLFSLGGNNLNAATTTTKDLAKVKNSYESLLVKKSPGIVTTVTATVFNKTTLVTETVSGILTITKFKLVGDVIYAVGTLNLPGIGIFPVEIPVTDISGTCKILQLDLGPLHLDLLGLVIDLNAIHLDITAQSGAGNLLGNLLCAIANLLNQGGPLSQLVTALNQLVGLLG